MGGRRGRRGAATNQTENECQADSLGPRAPEGREGPIVQWQADWRPGTFSMASLRNNMLLPPQCFSREGKEREELGQASSGQAGSL